VADVVRARDVTVRRGRRTVLRSVSLGLAAGEVVHLAGANGSGKTSLLRVLAGLADPRHGAIERHGACAFVPERVALAPALRCGEWLRAQRGLRELAPEEWAGAAAASGLDPAVLDRPAGTLSKGMLQRVALLEALRSGVPLLLLDEPFAGLDTDGRGWLAAELAERTAAGAALLFTDHSGAGAGRIAATGVLRLSGGACHAEAPDGRVPLRVRASHPDGRRLERAVAEHAADALLRALLDDGWHVEEVAR
jgi:heme exporter protein A